MGHFKEYLSESYDAISMINELLNELDEDELDEFGNVIYDEFFDEDDRCCEFFEMSDILAMVDELGSDMYSDILELLSEIDVIDEAVSRVMKKADRNRKKRKFMSNTKADLRKTKTARKKAARLSAPERKKSYRANKVKIKSYQKSRSKAIATGRHKVKLRRNA